MGKVGLDIALVMGTLVLQLPSWAACKILTPDIDPYFQASYITGTMVFAAGLTGASYCFHYQQLKQPLVYKLGETASQEISRIIAGVSARSKCISAKSTSSISGDLAGR